MMVKKWKRFFNEIKVIREGNVQYQKHEEGPTTGQEQGQEKWKEYVRASKNLPVIWQWCHAIRNLFVTCHFRPMILVKFLYWVKIVNHCCRHMLFTNVATHQNDVFVKRYRIMLWAYEYHICNWKAHRFYCRIAITIFCVNFSTHIV